jgi:hypothetical protein
LPRNAIALLLAIITGALVEMGYAAGGHDFTTVLTVLLMMSAAALATGGLLGFLFGIPKVASEASQAYEREVRNGQTRYAANTNLEQISDWLTKLLVGAGLAQAGNILTGLRNIVDGIASALDSGPSASPFVSSTLAFFSISGFVGGWLTTRLLLVSAMSRADRRALERFIDAEYAQSAGDGGRAEDLRTEAMQYVPAEVDALARRYELTRDLPRGPLRTAEMENLANTARLAAKSPGWTKEEVRQRFTHGNAGDRIFSLGLMQGDITLADYPVLLEAIESSLSGFEQYQGLVLARLLQPTLDPEQQGRLRDAVTAQLAADGRIRRNGARWAVAQSLLAAGNHHDRPSP